ncbi:MAG: hypothetical protein RLZ71_501 [Actinomycetota bacterium]
MPKSFGRRLQEAFETHGQLCVGIDPHASLLADWGLDDNATSLVEFGRRVIEASAGRVGVIKPQVSFFERFGAEGFAALEIVTNEARDAGLLVIADAKRGDIGTTMSAYLDAWFGGVSGFYADALTVSPYLGAGVYLDQMAHYLERGKGLFSLVATSNPEGYAVQKAVAADLWDELGETNRVTAGAGDKLGSFGAVVGATIQSARYGIDSLATTPVQTPILAPGFGAQGAKLADIKLLFPGAHEGVVASVSRSVLEAGPHGLAEAIDSHKAELAAGLE